ncbi:MAG TPA: hypothetical protein PLN71_16425 [Anaerolineae bacterium]|nr:hypothetical protein [Anaerolineae bacterium]
MRRYGWIGLSALILMVALMSNTGGAMLEASPAIAPTWTRVAPPTLTPTPAPPTATPPAIPPTAAGPAGAAIWLRMQGRVDDPRWQSLWTVVQWQDALGDWHDVEGWRGALDAAVGGEGRKVWWLPADLFGAGPFRWQVFAQPGGMLLATSEAFYLPESAGQIKIVTVTF